MLLSPTSNKAVGFTDCCGDEEFMVVDDNLLLVDYIEFPTCCDVVPSFDADADILPDLEVDPTELLAEFEDRDDGGGSVCTETKPPEDVTSSSSQQAGHDNKEEESPPAGGSDEKKQLLEGEGQKKKNGGGGDEAVTTADGDDSAAASAAPDDTKSSSASAASKKTKPSSKNSHGNNKRKVKKVDWTPELHRKFVQAVEQLGIDKAVPSRILEIMGIEGLTRHNIASHLQKYRSHRKHRMAREAEAATWAHKRQMYAAGTQMVVAAGAPRTNKQDDMPSPPFGRPLHVWGHPPPVAVEAAAAAAPLLPVWPRHLQPRPASYWHQQYNMPPPPPPPVTVMPPPVPWMILPQPIVVPMYDRRRPIPPLASLQLQLDAHPSKESIDAAIGDVLMKPWLPLPIGLKPPSLDSVMSELHKQGIPKIPPASGTTGVVAS